MSDLTPGQLNQWGDMYGLPRAHNEDDECYRLRLIDYIRTFSGRLNYDGNKDGFSDMDKGPFMKEVFMPTSFKGVCGFPLFVYIFMDYDITRPLGFCTIKREGNRYFADGIMKQPELDHLLSGLSSLTSSVEINASGAIIRGISLVHSDRVGM